jgi:DNA-binding NarL/FixJ family response regulator
MGWLQCDIDVSVSRFALGSKDESVGRALGSSVRTVRRTIGSLSARLDAGSRFELGVRAALGGLV